MPWDIIIEHNKVGHLCINMYNTHVQAHESRHVCVHVSRHMCIRIRHAHVQTHVLRHVYIHMYARIRMCVHISMLMCIEMSLDNFEWIHLCWRVYMSVYAIVTCV